MRRHLKLVHIRRFPREMNNGLHMHGRKGQKMKNPCETRCHHFALQVAAEGSVSEDERPVVSHSAITSLLMFPPLSHPKGLSGSCGSPQSLLPSPPLPVYRRSDLHAVSRRAEIPERERNGVLQSHHPNGCGVFHGCCERQLGGGRISFCLSKTQSAELLHRGNHQRTV